MKLEIEEAVIDARKYFEIDKYPGNFFNYIVRNKNYISKYKLMLFKQDLGNKNSGFIGYSDNELAFICINYKCNIGHQNFTLAHEIGHWLLHNGSTMTDNDSSLKFRHKNIIELQATKFAAELLYPMEFVKHDIKNIYTNNLLDCGKDIQLADYINELCVKYCISFKFALSRILFNSDYKKNHYVIKKVEEVINNVKPLSCRYTPEYHVFIQDSEFYKPYIEPLFNMKKYIDVLTQKEEIGYESGKSIFDKNKSLEGYNE